MAAGGKGHARRRENAALVEANWDAIFRRGVPEQSNGLGSNPSSNREVAAVGANPTSAAIYVDAESGAQVTEDWWPGMAVNGESNAQLP